MTAGPVRGDRSLMRGFDAREADVEAPRIAD
jgi:hypothetical protein